MMEIDPMFQKAYGIKPSLRGSRLFSKAGDETIL